jgi:hypothetical protein
LKQENIALFIGGNQDLSGGRIKIPLNAKTL